MGPSRFSILRSRHKHPSRLAATSRRKCCRHSTNRNERLRRRLPHSHRRLHICHPGRPPSNIPMRLQPRTRLDGHHNVLHVQCVHLERNNRQSFSHVRSPTRGCDQKACCWQSRGLIPYIEEQFCLDLWRYPALLRLGHSLLGSGKIIRSW
jgi:hypothetical protein